MRAISLWQPWASLWCSPAKVHETRHWKTDYRGWLAVHAAKRKCERDVGRDLDQILTAEFGSGWPTNLTLGAIIGIVEIVDCVEINDAFTKTLDADDLHCGNFAPGRFAWRREAMRSFGKPIPWIGRQGFFDVPDVVLR